MTEYYSGHPRENHSGVDTPPLDNDVQYVARIKADTAAHYQRNASPEALERMEWFRNWKPDLSCCRFHGHLVKVV